MKQLHVRAAGADDLAGLSALLARPVTLPVATHEQLLVALGTPAEGGAPQVLASLRLRPAIGLALPRLWYHVGTTVHAAAELGLIHRQRTLLLGHDHTGASELADIAWAADGVPLATQAAALHLLVHSAWLLIARDRGAYADRVMAELPGPRDSAGQSPFWHGLGRHFYPGDPASAAAAHGPAWRTHVAALLPRQLLYTSFLPAAAQAAIAQVHPAAQLLREVLEAAGLQYSHHVNLEDAGPVLEAATDALPGLASARAWRVVEAATAGRSEGRAATLLLLAGAGAALRVLRAPVLGLANGLLLTTETQTALGVQHDDTVWALASA